jgi:hypothetical protein
MDTNPLSCLPSRVTPNEVWSRCKAWGLLLKVAGNENEGTDSKEEDTNSEDEAFLLSELLDLNRRVKENAREGQKIVAKGGPKTSFTVGQFVTFAIPPKNRLSTEATSLPRRVIKVVRNAYALLSAQGPLKGLHQASTFRLVLNRVAFNIPESCDDKAKKLTLPQAITLSNNRKSILA